MKIKKLVFKIKEYVLYLLHNGKRYLKNNELVILSREESLMRVIKNCERESYRGFIRYGDGEYQLIKGIGIPFQESSEELSIMLHNALINEENLDIDIGVDAPSRECLSGLAFHKKISAITWAYYYTKELKKNQSYLFAAFTMPFLGEHLNDNIDKKQTEEFISKMIGLFENKKVVLFAGAGILNKISFMPFDGVKELVIEKSVSSNSFSIIDNLYNKAIGYTKDYLMCFAIGPTSKVLSYRLMAEGYRCFDLGHFLKDYDMYRSKNENFCSFFDVDE